MGIRMKAHLVQMDIGWEDKKGNYERVRRLLRSGATSAGDLVVLPEMFDTGFSFVLEKTADKDGSTLAFLMAMARELGVTVQGSRTVVGVDGRGRNCATVVGPEGLICEYHKVHPFTLGREVDFFTGGNEVTTYKWGGSSVCPAVCYDLRFPELFRIGLVKGAEVFAIGSNWPSSREGHRVALSIARAIENQAVVLSVNRCGKDPNLEYAGGTLAVGSRGEVLGQLGGDEGVLSVEIDLEDVRRWRRTFPAWRDHKLVGRRS